MIFEMINEIEIYEECEQVSWIIISLTRLQIIYTC